MFPHIYIYKEFYRRGEKKNPPKLIIHRFPLHERETCRMTSKRCKKIASGSLSLGPAMGKPSVGDKKKEMK